MAAEQLPVQLVCRVLAISESGYYDGKNRAPSARAILCEEDGTGENWMDARAAQPGP